MDIVLRESERLNDTIKSFLAYARPQRFALARLDIRRVVQDTAHAAAQQRRRARGARHRRRTCRRTRSGSRRTRTRSGRSSGTSRPTGCARCRHGGRLLLSAKSEHDGGQRRADASRSRTRAAAFRRRARRHLPAVPQLVREGHRPRPCHRPPHRHRLQRLDPGVVDGRQPAPRCACGCRCVRRGRPSPRRPPC